MSQHPGVEGFNQLAMADLLVRGCCQLAGGFPVRGILFLGARSSLREHRLIMGGFLYVTIYVPFPCSGIFIIFRHT